MTTEHSHGFNDVGMSADILVNKPDLVVFVPRHREGVAFDPSETGDSYNDHFQVVSDSAHGLLHAFWTQATKEGDIDQHIAYSRSADGGESWTHPVVLAGSANRKNPLLRASWQQPMLSKGGRLYCLWNQQTTSQGPHCGMMFGAYSDDAGETWSTPKLVPFPMRTDADPANPLVPPSWCNWQRPLRLGDGGRYFVGCSRHGKAPYDAKTCCKIEFWQFENIDENPEVEDIRVSFFATNRDALSAESAETVPGITAFTPVVKPTGKPEDPAVEEASVVKLPDGRLFALMRSSLGCPVWSQSYNAGHTWSRPRPLLDRDGGAPFLHPRSPCPIYDWSGPEAASGMYFALVHNAFDFTAKTAYQRRGPLYLIAGKFVQDAEQPLWFGKPRLFAPRPDGNSFYTSYCVVRGKGILWFNDRKYYLLGRVIGEEWFC